MRKFFIKSLFLIPLLLFLCYMEFGLGKIPNSYSYKRENLEKQLDSIQVLILGSSQAAHGINPSCFSLKTYNLSNISQSIYYDSKITVKYLDKMPKLEYAVINLPYISFGYQIIDGIESWRDYYYSQFWDINYPEIETFNLKRYSKIFLYTPERAISYSLQGFKADLIKDYKANGYVPYDTLNNYKNISDSLGLKRVKLHDSFYKEKRWAENQNYLQQLIEELQKRNIQVVLVTQPVFATYSKFVNKAKLKKTTDTINLICKKYNCKYLNYFTDNRFSKSDFYDNDHLNCIGADKFSKILNNDMVGQK